MAHLHLSGGKIALTSISLTLALIAIVVFALMPLLSKIERTNEEIHVNNQKIAQIRAEIDSHKRLAQEFRKIELEHELLKKMFPVKEEMVVLVEGLEASAASARLDHALTLQEDVSHDNRIPGLQEVMGISYELALTNGTYRQFIDFLVYLENQPFVTRLDSLTLSADLLQSDSGSLLNLGAGSGKVAGKLFVSETKQ